MSKLKHFIILGLLLLPKHISAAGLENPLREINSIQEFVTAFLKAVMYVGFPVAVLFVVYSGFLFVFAQGNSTELEKAKKNFFYTIIGVALFLGALALAKLIEGTINQLL